MVACPAPLKAWANRGQDCAFSANRLPPNMAPIRYQAPHPCAAATVDVGQVLQAGFRYEACKFIQVIGGVSVHGEPPGDVCELFVGGGVFRKQTVGFEVGLG